MLIFGIVISILGLLKHIFDEVSSLFCIGFQGEDVEKVYTRLSSRERQYMDFIRKKNLPAFGELLQHLMQAKDMQRSVSLFFNYCIKC